MLPSASVAASGLIEVAPALEAMVAVVTSMATGGVLPTGIVYVAALESTSPRLSVAVNVKVLFPIKLAAGSNFRLEACARVKTCPTVTAVVPSERYRTPSLAAGKVTTVKLAIVPSESVAVSGSIVVAEALEGMLEVVTFVATGGWFVTGIVKLAGLGSSAPSLSVAVYVKLAFPAKLPAGSNFKPPACAGVKT